VPELPEVETIARGLRPVLEGNRIVRAGVWRPNVVVGSVRAFTRRLRGRRIESVGRRAKLLRFELDHGEVWWTSLRMTGHYELAAPGAPSPAPAYARAAFDLASGHRLHYVDIRTLGKMGIVDRETWEARSAELGPEPLERSFTPAELHRRLRATRRRIKEVLLDQRVIAGVGNIYASEARHRAGIHPRARADRLSGPAARELHDAIREVLREAIRAKGTTVLTYAASDGESGAYQERLRVYDRAEEACPRCGGPVRRIVQAQRSTYFCPRCQRRR
jgi:formamidopyrimidine-DNA glycosylase